MWAGGEHSRSLILIFYVLHALHHAWRNPVECVILGLQSVGLMRQKMDDDFEKDAQQCNSLKDLRRMADQKANFSSTVSDSTVYTKTTVW